MYTKKEYQFFRFGELTYKKAYKLYQPIYFVWKKHRDRKLIKFLKHYIKPGMTVVDIGANIGFYTVLFSKMVGENGSVHAFEPDKLNFQHLISNTRKLKNIFANNLAVSDNTGKIKLYQVGSNVEHQTYDSGESKSFIEIDCISLDDYFNKGELIQLVKTDTEGYDYFVVKGMTEIMKKQKDFVLATEFWPWGLSKAGIYPEKFVVQLKEMKLDITFTDLKAEQTYEQMIENRYYITDIIAVLR